MEQVFGTLLRGLAQALSFFFEIIPSYGVAIVLLTVSVRVILLPLTIKQTRSMQAMGRVQPQIKALQRKHKGDRQKLNEEMMKLYKEHKVNPLGGCLPLLLQLPVFFALFSVLRAATPEIAMVSDPPRFEQVKDAFCTPVGEPNISGEAPDIIECDVDGDGSFERSFQVVEWRERDGDPIDPRDILTRCAPQQAGDSRDAEFVCQTPVGTGHLPADSPLLASIIEDGEPFVGMYLSCGATQAQSEDQIRQCAPRGASAGGAPLIGYYGLIALMVISTWYQTRQMQSMQGQQPGAQMIGRIMPVFLGFISLSIPAGVLVYWVTTNAWQIGQQYVMLKRKEAAEAEARPGARKDRGPEPEADKARPAPSAGDGRKPPQRHGGRNARSRKKRRKR